MAGFLLNILALGRGALELGVNFMIYRFNLLTAAALLGVALSSAGSAQATNLVVNGGFESNGGGGQINYNTGATGWSVVPSGCCGNSSYVFLFGQGTADTTGVTGEYGNVQLWGPNNGSANGLPATSPDGGYYLATDSDYQAAYIQQTINGMTAGDKYMLSFYWAASQQLGFSGDTLQHWQVSLGGQTQDTATTSLPSHGFSGWMKENMTFTATSSSELLSFLAVGNLPVPPFALLDGVSVHAVPEPMTLGLIGAGLAGAVVLRRRRASGKSKS